MQTQNNTNPTIPSGLSEAFKQAEPECVIDGRYHVVKRFGPWTEPRKMVFLARDLQRMDEPLTVVKVYTLPEMEEGQREIEVNQWIHSSDKVIRMNGHCGEVGGVTPFLYNGVKVE